jgi:polar amino acid transport system permease protein
MGNEVITLVKDTALVSVIGVSELLMVAKERQGALFSFVPLFIAGVFYFVMNWIVSIAFQRLEKKLSYYN